jgi:hypothetical protein
MKAGSLHGAMQGLNTRVGSGADIRPKGDGKGRIPQSFDGNGGQWVHLDFDFPQGCGQSYPKTPPGLSHMNLCKLSDEVGQESVVPAGPLELAFH